MKDPHNVMHHHNVAEVDVVTPAPQPADDLHKPFTIATISAGFEKGDFLVREEQGARIYFDFVSTYQSLCYMHTVNVIYIPVEYFM